MMSVTEEHTEPEWGRCAGGRATDSDLRPYPGCPNPMERQAASGPAAVGRREQDLASAESELISCCHREPPEMLKARTAPRWA